jgi:hypothetical protein
MARTHPPDPNPGVTVARAKRTRRAEARRRYRAEQGLPEETIESDDAQATHSAATSRATRPSGSGADQTGRLGIGTSFRLAFRPLDLRGDLQALPKLVTNKALWLPVLLTIGATGIFLAVRPQTTAAGDIVTVLSVFMLQYFIQTPAIGGVFIAGFLAPRASWLLGIIVGLVSAVCYAGLILSGALGVGTTAEVNEVILAGFAISPLMGALFASAAAWYRRFLQLSSPNRGRTGPPAKRGNDGRSRAANQKAGARR